MKKYVQDTVTMFDGLTPTGKTVKVFCPLKSKSVSPNVRRVLRALKMRWGIESIFEFVTAPTIVFIVDECCATHLEGFLDYIELCIMDEVHDMVGAEKDRTKSVAMKAFLYNEFYLELTESISLKESETCDDFE